MASFSGMAYDSTVVWKYMFSSDWIFAMISRSWENGSVIKVCNFLAALRSTRFIVVNLLMCKFLFFPNFTGVSCWLEFVVYFLELKKSVGFVFDNWVFRVPSTSTSIRELYPPRIRKMSRNHVTTTFFSYFPHLLGSESRSLMVHCIFIDQ